MSDAATPPTYALYYLFQTPEAVAIIVGLLVLVGLYFLKVKFPLGDKLFAQEEELDAR